MEDSAIRTLSKDDLDSVAAIHLNAFSERALASLGREAVRRYYRWQLDGPHEAIALGIFQDEKLAGFCFAGVFHGSLSGFLRRNRWYLTWRVTTHPWLILAPIPRRQMILAMDILQRRPISVVSQTATQAKSFGILAIAVAPNNQGMGLGKKLMAEIESNAVGRGFSRMHLTVDIDNDQAIAFYTNLDWQKMASTDGIWRGSMVKDLSGSFD